MGTANIGGLVSMQIQEKILAHKDQDLLEIGSLSQLGSQLISSGQLYNVPRPSLIESRNPLTHTSLISLDGHTLKRVDT
jgi:hypothetical protein